MKAYHDCHRQSWPFLAGCGHTPRLIINIVNATQCIHKNHLVHVSKCFEIKHMSDSATFTIMLLI